MSTLLWILGLVGLPLGLVAFAYFFNRYMEEESKRLRGRK